MKDIKPRPSYPVFFLPASYSLHGTASSQSHQILPQTSTSPSVIIHWSVCRKGRPASTASSPQSLSIPLLSVSILASETNLKLSRRGDAANIPGHVPMRSGVARFEKVLTSLCYSEGYALVVLLWDRAAAQDRGLILDDKRLRHAEAIT